MSSRFKMGFGSRFVVVLVFVGFGELAFAQVSRGDKGTGEQVRPEQMVEQALVILETDDTSRMSEARNLIIEASALAPTMGKLKLAQGLLYAKSRRGAEAIGRLIEYNTSDGVNDYRGYAALGEVYLSSYMFAQAKHPLEKARSLAPLEARKRPVKAPITLNLAQAHLGLQNRKLALKTAKEAETEAPDDGDIQLRLGEIAVLALDSETALSSLGRAIKLFESEIRDNPLLFEAHGKLRTCYEQMAKLHKTLINGQPDKPEAYRDYAHMLVRSSEVERRINLLNALDLAIQASNRDTNSSELKLLVVRIEVLLGAFQDARSHLEEILKDHPEDKQALAIQEQLMNASTPVILP